MAAERRRLFCGNAERVNCIASLDCAEGIKGICSQELLQTGLSQGGSSGRGRGRQFLPFESFNFRFLCILLCVFPLRSDSQITSLNNMDKLKVGIYCLEEICFAMNWLSWLTVR